MKIEKGVRQGDLLSPDLFNCVLEEISRNLTWEGRGIKINGEYLNNLRFADDVVILCNSKAEIEELGAELSEESRKTGLEINCGKTRILSNKKREKKVKIEGTEVQWKDEFTYLGQIV